MSSVRPGRIAGVIACIASNTKTMTAAQAMLPLLLDEIYAGLSLATR